MKKKRIKLSLKILIPTILAVFIGLTAGFSIIYKQTSELLHRQAMDELKNTTANIELTIESKLKGYMHALNTFNLALPIEDVVDVKEKEAIDKLLTDVLSTYPELSAAWIGIEASAVVDAAQYKNTDLHDSTGRFAAYYESNGGNIIKNTMRTQEAMDSSSDFYTVPLRSGMPYMTPATIYDYKGKEVIVTSIALPIKNSNGTIGVLGFDIALNELLEYVNSFKIYDSGYATLFDINNSIMTHPKQEFIGQNTYEDGRMSAVEVEMMDKVSDGGGYEVVKSQLVGTGEGAYKTFSPILFHSNIEPYTIQIVVPVKEVHKAQRILKDTLLGISISIIVILIVMIAGLVAYYMKKLSSEVKWLDVFSEGDFTIHEKKSINHSQDEIGDISRAINGMSEKLNKVMQKVNNSASEVTKSSDELSQSAAQSSQATQSIAESIAQVAEGTQMQVEHITHITNINAAIKQGIEEVVDEFKVIQEVSRETVDNAKQGKNAIEGINNSIQKVAHVTIEVEKANKELLETSKEIHTIIGLIEGIAKQTNLLSLNASIEAARAGEQGKGFAVVAAEITKLANEVNSAIKGIERLINENDNNLSNLENKLKECVDEVDRTVEGANQAKEKFELISQNIEDLSTDITQTDKVVTFINENNAEATQKLDNVEKLAHRQSQEAQECAAATEEQYATIEEISALSLVLAELSDELSEEIKKFTI